MFKKFIVLFCVCVFLSTSFVSCSKKEQANTEQSIADSTKVAKPDSLNFQLPDSTKTAVEKPVESTKIK